MRLTTILCLLFLKLSLMYGAQNCHQTIARTPDLPFLSFPNAILNVANQTIVASPYANNYTVYRPLLAYPPKKLLFAREQPPKYDDANYSTQQIDGDVLLIVDDTVFMVSHYFHFMEHLAGIWNFLTYQHPERVQLILFAFAATSVNNHAWQQATNNSTVLLLQALFPNAKMQNLNDLPRNFNLQAENIYVSNRIRSHLTSPAGYINMNGAARNAYNPLRLQQMRDRVFTAMNITPHKSSGNLRITYCKRTGRRILESTLEQQLLDSIASETGQPVQVVDFAAIPFKQQLQIVADTDLLIGVHGNGLTHLMFLPDNAAVLEYHQQQKTAFYRVFAQLRGIKYYGNSNKSWFTEKNLSLENSPEQTNVTAIDLPGTINIINNLAAKVPPGDTVPLGNTLSALFYYSNTNHAKSKYYMQIRRKQLTNLKDKELKEFFNKLDWNKKNVIIDYLSDPEMAHGQIMHGKPKPNYLQFWQEVRPQLQDFYSKILPVATSTTPVVHFRCSDAPFDRNTFYHLTKKKTVQWMAEAIKARGYSQLVMLSCNKHQSLDRQSCAKYAEFYKNIFEAAGLQVTKQCGSILADFKLMLSSPLLVSLNYSSYAFMAGIAKSPSNYISCNGGEELDGTYVLQNEADWILSRDTPLLHHEVLDYNNTVAVIKQLES